MKLERFKTNLRLWVWISLALFVVPWFLPIFNNIADRPALVWMALFAHLGERREALGALYYIGFFSVLFGVPAVAIGWVFHAVLLMAGGAMKQRKPGF